MFERWHLSIYTFLKYFALSGGARLGVWSCLKAYHFMPFGLRTS